MAISQHDEKDLDTIQSVQEERTGRIRYADDVENYPRGNAALRRSLSRGSVPINPLSRRQTIDPNVVLPVQYRTL